MGATYNKEKPLINKYEEKEEEEEQFIKKCKNDNVTDYNCNRRANKYINEDKQYIKNISLTLF